MKQFFVASHDTYASGVTAGTGDLDDLSSLATGAWVVINKDPESANLDKTVDISNASTGLAAIPAKFQLAFKTNEGVRLSSIINKATLVRSVSKATVAATAKVVAVGKQSAGDTTYGLNLPSFQAGDIVGVVVTDTSKTTGALNQNRTYTYTVVAGDTVAIIIAALIALINADTKRVVNAAVGYGGSTDSFKVTGITAGNAFEVSPVGIFRKTSIVATTANVLPSGTYAQLLKDELSARIEDGREMNETQMEASMWAVVSLLSSAKAYRVNILEFIIPSERLIPGEDGPVQRITIVSPSDLSSTSTGNTTCALDELAKL